MDRYSTKSLATELRQVINVQVLTETPDGIGGFTTTWTDSAENIYAAVYPASAMQVFKYKSTQVDATHIIKVRPETPVEEKINRVRFSSRYFEVLTVENIQERDVVLLVFCKEER